MELIKVVNYKKCYKGKDGEVHPDKKFYVVERLGEKEIRIAVRLAFAESVKDYSLLNTIARTVVIKSEDTPVEE